MPVKFALFNGNFNLLQIPGYSFKINSCHSISTIAQTSNSLILVSIEPCKKSYSNIISCIKNQIVPFLGKLQHVIIQIDDVSLLNVNVWVDVFNDLLIQYSNLSWHLLLPISTISFWQKLLAKLDYPENLAAFIFVKNNDVNLSNWIFESVSSLVLLGSQILNNLPKSKTLLENTFFNPSYPYESPIISIVPDVDISLLSKIQLELSNHLNGSINITRKTACILRNPLQPLRDNLDISIYDEFEKDQNKYHIYRQSIEKAIQEIMEKPEYDKLAILIIGPGKGPLVDITIDLLSSITNFSVYIVEKNGKCIDLLKLKNKQQWNNKVNIIHQDIRTTDLKLNFDLIISELLGSFACNELSPEILFSISPTMYNESTTWIPENYTNYIQPIYSPILTQMMNRSNEKRPAIAEINSCVYKEITEPQPLWTFNHNRSENHNRKLSKLYRYKFENTDKQFIHGFLGTFEANLFKEFNIGIHNSIQGTDQYCSSWCPIYFPLITPTNEKVIDVQFERCNDENGVWYSYTVNSQSHNTKGELYKISSQVSH